MIEYNIDIKLEEILDSIPQEKIFEYYLGIVVDLGESYTNPLRTDKKTGCRFYYNNKGKLRFHDFSKKFNWDCIDVVQKKHGLNFPQALSRIAIDFNLVGDGVFEFKDTIVNNFKPVVKTKPTIKIKIKKWESYDIEYWNQYKINEFFDTVEYCTYFDIHPCSYVWVNGNRFNCSKTDPCYAYYFGKDENGIDEFKLYFPKRKEDRFYQNNSFLLQGYNKLPETGENLVITKSYKDVVCLKLFDIASIAPMSETVLITEKQYTDLYNRFDNIYSLMDNDRTGKHMAWLLRNKYEIMPLLFPNDMKKDFSDNLKEYEIIEIQDIIDSI
jgi:hypothetical protein